MQDKNPAPQYFHRYWSFVAYNLIKPKQCHPYAYPWRMRNTQFKFYKAAWYCQKASMLFRCTQFIHKPDFVTNATIVKLLDSFDWELERCGIKRPQVSQSSESNNPYVETSARFNKIFDSPHFTDGNANSHLRWRVFNSQEYLVSRTNIHIYIYLLYMPNII